MNTQHPAFGGFPPPEDPDALDSSSNGFDPYDDPRPTAKNKVIGPAIGLIVIGVLCVLSAIFMSLFSAQAKSKLRDQNREYQKAEALSQETKKMLISINNFHINYLPYINAVNAIVGAIIAIGGVQMMTLSARWLCYIACILSFLPVTASCCCCLGMIFGVWGIVMLGNKDVVTGFAYQAKVGNRKK